MLCISNELGNKKRKAEAFEMLGASYYQEGNVGQSIGYGVELLRISQKLENKKLERHVCDFLAKLHDQVEGSEQGRNTRKNY